MNSTEKVKEFHQRFEHPIGINTLCEEPLKIRQLRVKLLFEELHELAEAGDVELTFHELCEKRIKDNIAIYGHDIGKFGDIEQQPLKDGNNPNKIEELDAITDIQYVLDGKKITSGLYSIADKAFELVHENNMNKSHRDYQHLLDTVSENNWLENDYSFTEDNQGRFMLYNRDKKLTKPLDHKKVDLSVLFV